MRNLGLGRRAARRTEGPDGKGGTRVYASALEARYASVLEIRRKAGEIASWEPQRKCPLYCPDMAADQEREHKVADYVVDFWVTIRAERYSPYVPPEVEAVECKGWVEPVAALKMRWFRAQHPNIPLKIIKAADVR